jgi:hypothetical protein
MPSQSLGITACILVLLPDCGDFHLNAPKLPVTSDRSGSRAEVPPVRQ